MYSDKLSCGKFDIFVFILPPYTSKNVNIYEYYDILPVIIIILVQVKIVNVWS